MIFSGKKQTYKLDKIKRMLVESDVIDLQEKANSFKEDTLDAVLRRLLDNGVDPAELVSHAEVDMEKIVDDGDRDLFDLVTTYANTLSGYGISERDPGKIIAGLLAKAQQTEQTEQTDTLEAQSASRGQVEEKTE